MGEREVDDIIEQWRASAQAAGEPARSDGGSILRRAIERIGILRAVLSLTAVCIFAAVAVPLLRADPDPLRIPTQEADHQADDPIDRPRDDGAPVASAEGAAALTDPPGAAASQPPAARVEDWFTVITTVDQARSAAYGSADNAPLAGVFAPEGAASAREGGLVAALAAKGAVAEGWRTEVLAVSPVEQTADHAILRVRDRREEYRLVERDGAATTVPASAPVTWLVTLRREGGDWLVVDAVPEATSPTEPP